MPEFDIQLQFRPIPGNEAVITIGEVLMSSQERIYSYDLDLKTLKNIVFTPKSGKYTIDPYSGQRDSAAMSVTKYIYNEGEPDNWATVHIWDHDGAEHTGSVWLNFWALGE